MGKLALVIYELLQMGNHADLVLHCDGVPRHVNALDWAKGSKRLSDGVLSELVVYGAHIDPTHDGQSTLPLSRDLPIKEKNK